MYHYGATPDPRRRNRFRSSLTVGGCRRDLVVNFEFEEDLALISLVACWTTGKAHLLLVHGSQSNPGTDRSIARQR
jgi:hypothetical protein